MKFSIKNILFILTLFPTYSLSIGIDSMVKVADNGTGHFTVTNSEDYRQFIQVALASVNVVNGELKMTPYTRDNISSWTLNVRPARTIVDTGLQKEFKVDFTPKPNTNKNIDHVYQLTFVPTPYFSKGEKIKHAMQIALGFAPIFIVPAEKDAPLHFNVTRNKDSIKLINKGDTYIRAYFSSCEKGVPQNKRDACSTVVHGLSGRHLEIPVPSGMKKAKIINVEFTTHNLDYEENFKLTLGQSVEK